MLSHRAGWRRAVLLGFSLAALTAGCNKPSEENGCAAGEKAGGGIGRFLGQTFGNVVNNVIPYQLKSYTGSLDVVGTSRAGFQLLGSKIGCSLNSADKQKAVDAVRVATISGHTQTWTGTEPGVSGKTQVISNDGACRTVKQTVTLGDGTQETEDVKSCRGASGDWEVAPE